MYGILLFFSNPVIHMFNYDGFSFSQISKLNVHEKKYPLKVPASKKNL